MLHTYVRHAKEGEFRLATPGTFVRDLGVGEITGGELTAQVVRIEPEGAYIEELHRHDEGFSLAYVLKGWLDVEFEEIGVQHLGPGTVIPAYNGPRHHELACGDGFELLLLVTRKSMSGDDRQRIIVQQERDAPYRAGLRDDFLCRDFELEPLTGGRMVAQAIKALPGKRIQRRWHAGTPDFRFVYEANGWAEFEYEDIGTVRLEKDSMVYQPPMIRHAEVACSDDAVIVEVVTPPGFEPAPAGLRAPSASPTS
jgi:quercetin dioxygenase-like cupin family protein